MLISRRPRITPTNATVSRCGHGSTVSSATATSLPPWIAFWRAYHANKAELLKMLARAAGNPAVYQWLREPYPLPGQDRVSARGKADRLLACAGMPPGGGLIRAGHTAETKINCPGCSAASAELADDEQRRMKSAP